MVVYEQLLDRSFDWALMEGSLHFEKKSAVHKSLRKVAGQLQQHGIAYAVVGSMAMFFYGYRRFTENVNILVTPDGLREVQRRMTGPTCLWPDPGGKRFRDAEWGVRVEFCVTGEGPGNGRPTAVTFPDPARAFVEIDGMFVLAVPGLVELKLASGLVNASRLGDHADVMELIAVLQLPEAFAEQLDPSVREKYRELWAVVRDYPDDPWA